MTAAFPLFLKLDGAGPVVLAGGGELALRKARIAKSLGARIVLAADPALPELAALADVHLPRALLASDLAGAALLISATGDDALDAQASAWARAAQVPVNVPDRIALSTVLMPAIVDRAPVLVAIGTGGAAPVLARRIREQIERALPSALGALGAALDSARATLKALGRSESDRRRALETLADAGLAQGRTAFAQAEVLAAAEAPPGGSVTLVGAGPGDPDLLTLKALRALQDADVIVHDKLVDDRVLEMARRDARRIYVGKSKAQHTLSQDAINALLVREAQAGCRVVRLKGGDCFVFGRGGEEVEALRAAGVPVAIVPGVTAALACAASAEIPLTHRDAAHGLTLVTGHGKDGEPELDWTALARLDHTLAIYMGVSAAGTIAARLIAAGLPGSTPAAVVENGTRPDEKILTGTLDALPALIAAHGVTGPALLLIGAAVARGRASARTPLALAAE